MFDREVGGLDTGSTLEEIEQTRALALAAETHVLRLAAHWADLHPALVDSARVLPGTERMRRLGGDGTPTVSEFAADELALSLETSGVGARMLIADALDLRHRLPLLWQRVQAGEVAPWMARKAAQATRDHSPELAARIDTVIAPVADRVSLGRLEGLIAATWKRLDPAGAAQAEASARTELGVWVRRSSVHGTSTLFARLDSPDALRVDAALARAAEALRALGDTRSLDQRRAAAMGVLADPQDALDLWSAHAARAAANGTAEQPPPFDHHDRQDPPALGSAPHEPTPAEPTVAVRPSLWRRPDNPTPGRGPGVVLYVHLSDQTLRAGQGVTRVEDIGPMTAATVREWLAGTGARISVRPLLDLAGQTPVDAYEIPTRIADAVRLRTPVDCFPYATGTSRRMDLDHTEPYQPPDHGGPPGQTRTDNLGPLTRRHHRIKTHGHGWAVRQVFEGVFVWRTPHGRHYLVDHTGTTKASSVA